LRWSGPEGRAGPSARDRHTKLKRNRSVAAGRRIGPFHFEWILPLPITKKGLFEQVARCVPR